MTVLHDAGTGEDDLGPLRLQTDDRAATLGIEAAVQLDLAVDLRTGQLAALHHRRVVRWPGRAGQR